MNLNDPIERMHYLKQRQTEAHAEGIPALHRLMVIARRDTGQSGRVAAFLLGLYNGNRFKFNLNDLRGLDMEIFDDCIKVLRMDAHPQKEVCDYFDDAHLFERLAVDWGMARRNSEMGLDN